MADDVEALFANLRGSPFIESVNAIPQELGNRGGVIPQGWLADNSVTADVIQAGSITAGKIAAGSITANEIAAGTITSNEIAANTITAGDIAASTITGDRLAANTITGSKIAADAITTNELAANAVETENLLAANVTSSKIVATITGKKYGSNDGAAGAPGFFFDAASNYGLWRNASTPTLSVAGGQSFAFGAISSQSVAISPDTDNTYWLGTSGARWTEVWAVDGTINTSDRSLKRDIVDSPLGLGFLRRLRPVAYRWRETPDTQARIPVDEGAIARESRPHEEKIQAVRRQQMANELSDAEGDALVEEARTAIRGIHERYVGAAVATSRQKRPGRRVHYGLIAQEVKEALDAEGLDAAFWKESPEGLQSLAYSELIAPLIAAVQELAARVEALEA